MEDLVTGDLRILLQEILGSCYWRSSVMIRINNNMDDSLWSIIRTREPLQCMNMNVKL
jgi:hypothetical protein